jgi:orotidine-5'-phosphate decarboxylase
LAKLFGYKLVEAQANFGSLCVGVDPHAALLKAWGLADESSGIREFALRVVEASAGRVAAIKPQVSFFERFGAKGYEVLSEITNLAQQMGLLVIADAKRGDIGTTMDAYLDAWFGEKSGLYADALTVSPYLGLGATAEVFEKWISKGKGVYSLVATSNPQGETVQRATILGETLASSQWRQLSDLNGEGFGPFGAVLGATLDLSSFGIDSSRLNVPILAPGFGAQGAVLSNASNIFGALAPNVLYSVSRSVLEAGSKQLVSAIDSANAELRNGLNH